MIPPPHAVKLPAVAPPAGADPAYLRTYYAALASVSVAFIWLTPADAQWILDNRNPRNRPMRASWRLLREKINSLLFRGDNGETAIFDRDGNVMSFQHRLKAIASGDKAVFILAVFGVDPETFATLDQGNRRNGKDVLALVGAKNADKLAGALTWAHRYAGAGIDQGAWHAIPNEQIETVAQAYKDMPQSVLWAVSKKSRKLAPLSLLAFIHHTLTEADPAAAGPFFEKVADGIGVTRQSWEYALRGTLSRLGPVTHYTSSIHVAALFFKAFNYSRSGRPVIEYERNGKPIEPSISWKSAVEPFPDLDPPAASLTM